MLHPVHVWFLNITYYYNLCTIYHSLSTLPILSLRSRPSPQFSSPLSSPSLSPPLSPPSLVSELVTQSELFSDSFVLNKFASPPPSKYFVCQFKFHNHHASPSTPPRPPNTVLVRVQMYKAKKETEKCQYSQQLMYL